jgi:hypothetical protein
MQEFFNIQNDFISSKIFDKLTPKSLKLYLYMVFRSNNNQGFIYHNKIYFIAKQYIYKHLRELESNNLIKYITNKEHGYVKYTILTSKETATDITTSKETETV